MKTIEDDLPPLQLRTLPEDNDTVISYQAYVRFGKEAIIDHRRKTIGKEVRVTVKRNALLSVEEMRSRHYKNSDAPL